MSKHLQLVRFRFMANGHTKDVTGHMIIRWIPEDSEWSISSWKKSDDSRSDLRGKDPAAGAKLFVDDIDVFVLEWRSKQQDAINLHRMQLGQHPKKHGFSRPGFRPITMEKQWIDYEKGIRYEAELIQADVSRVTSMLFEGNWCPEERKIIIPPLNFKNPWDCFR